MPHEITFTSEEGHKVVAEPEPTNRLPPDWLAFEEWGVLVAAGGADRILAYAPAVGPRAADWWANPKHRYLIGVVA